jgi:hypothetical protein
VGSNPGRGADVYEYFCVFLLSCFGRVLAIGGPHVRGEFPNAYEQDSETQRAGKLSAAFGWCANTQIRALRFVYIQSIALAVGACACNHLFLFFLFILFSKTVRWPLALTQLRMNNWVELYFYSHYEYLHSWLRRDCTFVSAVSSAFVVEVCYLYLIQFAILNLKTWCRGPFIFIAISLENSMN